METAWNKLIVKLAALQFCHVGDQDWQRYMCVYLMKNKYGFKESRSGYNALKRILKLHKVIPTGPEPYFLIHIQYMFYKDPDDLSTSS